MNHQPNTPASRNEAVAGKALQNVYMTLAEVPCECSARRREEGGHLSGCHLFDLCAAIDALAAPGAAREQEIIAQFLARTGQYVTNDASREAAVVEAVENALDAREQEAPELLLGWKRYEKARKLSPFQWNRLHIRNLAGENFDAMIDSLPEPTTPVPTPSEALSPATVAQPVGWAAVHFGGKRDGKIYNTCDTRDEVDAYIQQVHQSSDSMTLSARPLVFADAAPSTLTDAELGAAAYKGFDDYWTEDSLGKERDAWTASAKAVLKLAQPCASQGCGGAVQEAVANVVSCWNRFRWAKETSDAVSALAALSTDKSGGADHA